jgi:hypothetical protein
VTNFDSREYDYRQFEHNPDTEFHVCNLTTQKYFRGQMAHYTFVNQCGPFVGWREHMHGMCRDAFGEATAKALVSAMAERYQVEALARSRKFGIVWERKYWWLYGMEILIDCESSYGIRTLRTFVRKAGTLRKDLLAYARSLDRARSFVAGAIGKSRGNDTFLRKDFAEPLLWTIDFLDWRVRLMLAFCELAGPARSLRKALALVDESLAILDRYLFTVQECRKDFPSNVRPQTLAVIGDTLSDALANGHPRLWLRGVLKAMSEVDEIARAMLGKLLRTSTRRRRAR